MPQTNNELRHQWRGIAERAAAQFCLFSVALFLCVAAMSVTLVPLLTRVEVDGEKRPVTDLLNERAALTAQLAAIEAKRDELVLPVQDEQYRALRDDRQARAALRPLVQHINQLVEQSRQGGRQTVMLQSMAINYADGTLRLRGDVRYADAGSMTVLAWFVDSLRTLPAVDEVPTPPFTRETDPYIGHYSPFDITITLALQ